jgi:hypothetical protein
MARLAVLERRPVGQLSPLADRCDTDLFLPTGEISDTQIYLMARAAHQMRVKTSAGIEEVTMLFPERTAEQLLAVTGPQAAS